MVITRFSKIVSIEGNTVHLFKCANVATGESEMVNESLVEVWQPHILFLIRQDKLLCADISVEIL